MTNKKANSSSKKADRSNLDRAELADAILSSALDCIIVSDSEGHIIEFNQAAERTFGFTRAEIIGRTMEHTIIPHHHRDAHRQGMQRFLATGKAKVVGKRVELEALRSDGHIFPIELTISEARLHEERVFVATLRDVTAQKRAAAELHQARASLQAFFDHVPVGIFINKIRPGGKFDQEVEFANDNVGKPYGLRGHQLIGVKPYSTFAEDPITQLVKDLDEQIFATKKPVFHTMLNRHNNRHEHYTRFPILNEAGEITHIGGVNLDIDDQVRAQTQLEEARATLSAIFDNIPAALYLRDRDDRLVMMNNWGAEFLGRDPASMIGQPMSRFREPQNVDRVKAVDENIIRTGKPETHEFTYHLPSGDRTGLMTFFPVSDSHGEISHIGGMLLDVTELQKARADLQQAQATLESIFDNIPAELYLRELDGSFVMMNKWGANYYGKEPHQMVGELASDYGTGSEIEIAGQTQAKLLQTGKPVTQEYNYTIDGRNVKVQNTIFPVKNAEGKIVRIGGVTTDVTELHNARSQRDEAQFLIQSIFDNAPIELYLRELDGTYTMMNKWGANYVGMEDPADMVGKNFVVFDAAEEVELSWAAQKKMIETGQPVTREFHYTIAGNAKALQNTIFPVRDATGQIVRIGGVSIDVTALNLARDQRDEARVLIQTIFDNAPVELYLRELDGRYIMMNKWGANYFGVKSQDLEGGHFVWSYDTEEETKRARKAQATLLETGKPVTREFQHTIDGKRITAQNTIFPIRDSEGRIVRIGGISIDFTDLNNARDQLQRAQENLHQSEKLAALGQLLAGVAHELNNPLAVVLGRAAMLQERLLDTPHAAPLQKLREAADRCTRIVRTFLAMARQTGPRREVVEVNDLIDSALEMTTYSLRTHDVTWNKSLLHDGLTVEADQDQIVQVLINLILNAQQALLEKPDNRKLDISVSLCPDTKWLSIAVADNGPGVPTAIVSRIFDPFFTTKSVGEGTGLGLSVCKSMVEAHGGKLILETTPGGGATFRITLPVHAATNSTRDKPTGQEKMMQSKGRFLIIDDEVEIAAILADCLAPLGLESVIVSDGQAALDRLADTAFDGVFCDVSMPGMDGITFYSVLKSRNPMLANRLVFVSGDVLHRDWEKLKTAAGRPIIEKPFDPQQIREEALRLLQQKGAMP